MSRYQHFETFFKTSDFENDSVCGKPVRSGCDMFFWGGMILTSGLRKKIEEQKVKAQRMRLGHLCFCMIFEGR